MMQKTRLKVTVLLVFALFLGGCDYKYGYRVCEQNDSQCLDIYVKFKNRNDCESYRE